MGNTQFVKKVKTHENAKYKMLNLLAGDELLELDRSTR